MRCIPAIHLPHYHSYIPLPKKPFYIPPVTSLTLPKIPWWPLLPPGEDEAPGRLSDLGPACLGSLASPCLSLQASYMHSQIYCASPCFPEALHEAPRFPPGDQRSLPAGRRCLQHVSLYLAQTALQKDTWCCSSAKTGKLYAGD